MNYAAAFPSSSSDHEVGSSSEDSDEVDETLVRELRESLHFCVGKICRAEEEVAAKIIGDNDNSDDDDIMATSSSKKVDTIMSKEAIAALTELVYHYSTSSLANDLTAFSNHANRRTVKVDDVLLVARKEKHILAELQRKLQSTAIGQWSNKGNSTTTTAAAAGKKKTKKTNSNNNNTARKSPKPPLVNSGKKKTTKTKSSSMLLDSSSSSSSSSSDSDIDSMVKIRQRRRLDLKQKNLNKTAFGQGARNNNKDDDDDDSSSDSSSSSSDDGLDLKMGKTSSKSSDKMKMTCKNNPKNRATVDTEDDNMVIDLQDSDSC